MMRSASGLHPPEQWDDEPPPPFSSLGPVPQVIRQMDPLADHRVDGDAGEPPGPKATRLRYVSAESNTAGAFLAKVTHKGGQAAGVTCGLAEGVRASQAE